MSKSSLKSPSLMRYARVQQVLEQEPAFVAKMSDRSETVCKPNGDQQKFSPEVIQVTQIIHDSGRDAHKVQKTEIIRIACQVFGILGAAPAVNGAVVDPPAVKQSPPPAPEAKKQHVSKPAKPPKPPKAAITKPAKPAKIKAPKAKAEKPQPPPVAQTPESDAEEDEPEPAAVKPAAVEVDGKAALLEKTKEVLNDRPGESPSFNAYISIYTLVLTALQLTEIYDNQAGKEKRLKTLDDLAREVNKFTSIKGAKEAQKAQS